MPDAPPPTGNADRNLLFGILALQMDFISRDDLIAAMHAWVLDKTKPLGQILQEQGVLGTEEHTLLAALVVKSLQRHGNDPEKSLAALSSLGSVRRHLQEVADPDLQASLGHVSQAPDADADPFVTRAASLGTPTSTGLRFRILRPHAKGGLGQVSVALDEELHREVALKEIQDRHADRPESRARFLLEAEITGGLEHPGIVPVYGLGSYADGRPFYAMRFIRGDSLHDAITRFHQADEAGQDAGERTLALRQLLGRFVDVCNAVAYAHSRGVLHRDLKPGNVMLGKYGETLVVDWGLAKALGQTDPEPGTEEAHLRPVSASGSAATQMGTALGTPAYMSPEQAAGRLDQLGPASDVYSLGATLYILLTGRPPFADADGGVLLQKVGRGEFLPPRQVKPEVPPALEAICLQAMSQRPRERYVTALTLAAEIEHWLADEPVQAYREPLAARGRRWMRRHRALVTGFMVAVGVGLVGLAAGLLIVTSLNRRLDGANADLAAANANERQARERAEEVLRYFVTTFRRADPSRDGAQVTIAEVLKQSARELSTDAKLEPATRGALLNAIGQTYMGLGLTHEAPDVLEQALATRLEHLGPDHRDTLTSMVNLSVAYQDAGRLAEALALQQEALKLQQTQLGRDHPDTLGTMNNLALTYTSLGRQTDALLLFEETLKLKQAQFGQDHPDVLVAMNNLAEVYEAVGRFPDALRLFEETLKIRKRTLAPDHPDVLLSMHNLATAYQAAGRLAEALPLHEETLKAMKVKLGPEHPLTLKSMNNLALTYKKVGRPSDALPLFEETLKQRKSKLGPDHPDTLTSLSNVAEEYRGCGRFADAVRLQEETVERTKAKLGLDHPITLAAMTNLAAAYNSAGRLADAVRLHEETLKLKRVKLGLDHPDTLRSMNNLANAYLSVNRLAEAIALFAETLKAMTAKLGPEHPDTIMSMNNLAEAYREAHQLGDALPLREETLKRRKAKLGPDHPDTLDSMNRLAVMYESLGRFADAVPLYEEALRRRGVKLGPDHVDTLLSMNNLAGAYQFAGRLTDALPLLQEVLPKRRGRPGAEPLEVTGTLSMLGWVLTDLDRAAEAEPFLRECLALREKHLPAGHWLTANARSLLGGCLAKQRQFQAAEPLLLQSHEAMRLAKDTFPPRLQQAGERLVQLYTAWGKLDQADEWRQKLQEAKKTPRP